MIYQEDGMPFMVESSDVVLEVRRTGQNAETYKVTDAADVRYYDNDCVGDFQRGFNDDTIDRMCIMPGNACIIRTRVAKMVIVRVS